MGLFYQVSSATTEVTTVVVGVVVVIGVVAVVFVADVAVDAFVVVGLDGIVTDDVGTFVDAAVSVISVVTVVFAADVAVDAFVDVSMDDIAIDVDGNVPGVVVTVVLGLEMSVTVNVVAPSQVGSLSDEETVGGSSVGLPVLLLKPVIMKVADEPPTWIPSIIKHTLEINMTQIFATKSQQATDY